MNNIILYLIVILFLINLIEETLTSPSFNRGLAIFFKRHDTFSTIKIIIEFLFYSTEDLIKLYTSGLNLYMKRESKCLYKVCQLIRKELERRGYKIINKFGGNFDE
jgi:hypothetical protein